jgi:hypothetical protein
MAVESGAYVLTSSKKIYVLTCPDAIRRKLWRAAFLLVTHAAKLKHVI